MWSRTHHPIAPLARSNGIWLGRLFLTVSAGLGGSAAVVLSDQGGLLPIIVGIMAGFVIGVIGRQWLAVGATAWELPPPGGRLFVLLPARNEAQNIRAVIQAVPRDTLTKLGWHVQVLVVDDGSTDGTGAIATAAGADLVCRSPTSHGLGAALRRGLDEARARGADAAVYLDADGEYDAAQMTRLLEPLRRGQADYVLGSRFLGRRRGMTRSRTVGNRLLTGLMVLLTGRRLTDAQTGYRAFSSAAIAQAEIIHDYNYAQVLTLDLLRKGARVREVPIDYQRRTHGRSFIRGAEYIRRVVPAIGRELLAD